MLNRGIETFLAVVAGGSINSAARMLNITQSSVSQRLKKLEDEIGYVLIDRRKGGRTIRLTPAGESFFLVAENMQSLLQGLSGETFQGGSLKIGCVDSINIFLLSEMYKAMRRHSPPVQLNIGTHQSGQIYDLVERRELDIGFVLQERRSQYLRVTPFWKEDMLVIRARQASLPPLVSPSELDPREELCINWGPKYQLWHDRHWNPMISPDVQLDTIGLIRLLLESKGQWAIVPSSARPILEAQGYVFQRLSSPPPERVCYQIVHRYPRAGAVRALKIWEAISTPIRNAGTATPAT
jgi:DNA-binding transcriptional LysR family regulator